MNTSNSTMRVNSFIVSHPTLLTKKIPHFDEMILLRIFVQMICRFGIQFKEGESPAIKEYSTSPWKTCGMIRYRLCRRTTFVYRLQELSLNPRKYEAILLMCFTDKSSCKWFCPFSWNEVRICAASSSLRIWILI